MGVAILYYCPHFVITVWTETRYYSLAKLPILYASNKCKGSDQFENEKDMLEKIKTIKVIKKVCPNDGSHCTKGFYPKSENPENYGECYLKNKSIRK